MAAVVVLVFSMFSEVHSLLCDPKNYATDIKQKLMDKIGDKYEIITGKLWWQHFTGDGTNPSGDYGVYNFPSDITMSDVWFDTMIHCHDAFIFAGCTPPEARYYNIGSYTQNRYNVNITDTSANITQYALFPQEASLSSSLNYLNINITTGNSFNSLTTIIHTGDNATYSDIMNALNYTSVSNSNLIQIPHDYFKFAPYGVNNRNFATYPLEFNSYLPLWRLESPLNKTEYTQYVSKNPNRLQTVYYLQYKHIDPSNDTQNVV
eukprot:358457_1